VRAVAVAVIFVWAWAWCWGHLSLEAPLKFPARELWTLQIGIVSAVLVFRALNQPFEVVLAHLILVANYRQSPPGRPAVAAALAIGLPAAVWILQLGAVTVRLNRTFGKQVVRPASTRRSPREALRSTYGLEGIQGRLEFGRGRDFYYPAGRNYRAD